MSLNTKVNGVPYELAEKRELPTIYTQEGGGTTSAYLVGVVYFARQGRVGYVHCATSTLKAATAGNDYWLMSVWGANQCAWNVYHIPVEKGYIKVIRDSGNSNQANISFVPSTDLPAGTSLVFDVTFWCNGD